MPAGVGLFLPLNMPAVGLVQGMASIQRKACWKLELRLIQLRPMA